MAGQPVLAVSIPSPQADAAAALHSLAGTPAQETHISAVFIGADTVWKLKKAVQLGFLDFTDLDARRRFLLRELELNRDGAPGLYRDVVALRRTPRGVVLDPGEAEGGDAAGETVDWVLRMARVPAADFFPELAARDALTPELLDATADAVAEYHARVPRREVAAESARMLRVAEGNARAAHAAGLPPDRTDAWLGAIRAAIAARAAWLDARGRSGFVGRAHGDLHIGNLCLWKGRPTLFDALEFDEELATIDLGYDLAFLLMDLDRRLGRAAANRVLNRTVARTGDAALPGGLPVWMSVRAMVRAHVTARTAAGDGAAGRAKQASGRSEAASYLDAALAYLRPEPGIVLAIGGLQGTGKSTLARTVAPALGAAPGALILRSDEIRKRLHGAAPEQRLPDSAYSAEANARTNAALLEAVRQVAETGHCAVADATFLDPAQRDAVRDAARAAGRPFLGVWLHAPMPVLEARLAARMGDASDATGAVLRRAAETPAPGTAEGWVPVDATDREAALAALRGAVRDLLPNAPVPC